MELNYRVYEFTWDSLRALAQGFYMRKTPSFPFMGCSFGCSEYNRKPEPNELSSNFTCGTFLLCELLLLSTFCGAFPNMDFFLSMFGVERQAVTGQLFVIPRGQACIYLKFLGKMLLANSSPLFPFCKPQTENVPQGRVPSQR